MADIGRKQALEDMASGAISNHWIPLDSEVLHGC
jgi:hypothetical protein